MKTFTTASYSVATNVTDGGKRIAYTFIHLVDRRVVCIGSNVFIDSVRAFAQDCMYTDHVDRLTNSAFMEMQRCMRTIREEFEREIITRFPVYKTVDSKRIKIN